MKMFLLALSLVAMLNQPILLLNSGSDYNPSSFWDFGYDLNYIVDHFFTGVDKGLDIIDDFTDIINKFGISDKQTVQSTPSVKYYNQANNYTQNNTSFYEYKSFTQNYDNRTYSTTYNYDNRSYTYNPIYNDYRTYDYKTYKTYNYFEDNDYYYITNNNITNYEFYIVSKIDVNDNRFYSYYYELPSGSKSYNLTKEQVLGEFMSYDCYQYNSVPDDPNLLGLWHLDGDYHNELDNGYSLVYNGNSFVNGKFDGSLKLDGTIDMQLIGDMPDQYTLEFWFYNNINNGTYSGCCPPNTWCHCAHTYDNGVQRCWFNGVESTKATHKSAIITGFTRTASGSSYDSSKYTSNISYSSAFGNRLPSVTIGDSTITTVPTNKNGYWSGDDYYQLSYTSATFTPSTVIDPNDPLHYYPQLTTSGVEFGFTGVGVDTDLTSYNVGVHDYYSRERFSSEWLLSGHYNYATYNNPVITGLTSSTTSTDYVDMSECLMDEIRLTKGLLYTDTNFTYPLDKFSYGHIWERPSGDDFNVGDISIQTDITITDYRIGGADYSYPSIGNVYVGLNSNVGLYAKVYNGQNWIPCDFGVWNGSQWADGVGFNFLTLTWGVKNNDINIDVNISTDVNVTETDKKGFTDIVGFIFELFAFIPLCIGFLTLIPTPINIILIGLMGLLAVLIVLKIVKR